MTVDVSDAGSSQIFDPTMPSAPYPGLRAFEQHEWPVFFGRERMIAEVADRLIDRHMVVVHGDSGCGKSSLIRAGVLTQLEQHHLRSGLTWRSCTILPRGAPISHLAEALAMLGGDGDTEARTVDIHRMLNLGRDAPGPLSTLLRKDEQDHICILVDQFEELFRFAGDAGAHQAQRLVEFLVGLQNDPPPGLYVILTMRSEFLGACARFPGLAEAVNATQYLLPHMAFPELMRAIVEPARLYDGNVTPKLAERLIEESSHQQDQLPLIQHGLNLLWHAKTRRQEADKIEHAELSSNPKRQPDWQLDIDDYRRSGGLDVLLSGHADRIMADVAPDQQRQRIVEHLFRALTDINADGHAIRRPQSFEALCRVTGAVPDILRPILNAFRQDGVSFLTPIGEEPIEDATPIDISHEALIRCWQKLADQKDGWLQQEFQDGMVWRSLKVQAVKFRLNPEETLSPAATLDRQAWLDRLPSTSWSERYQGGWDDVQALMVASHVALKRQTAKDRWIKRGLAAGLLLFAMIAALSAWSYRQARELASAALLAQQSQSALIGRQAEEVLRQGSPDRAISLALSALKSVTANPNDRGPPAVMGTLIEAYGEQRTAVIFEGHEGPVYAVGFSPDGRQIVSGSLDRTIRLWDSATGEMLLTLQKAHEGAIRAVTFSPDQNSILSGGNDGMVRLWDARSGNERLTLGGQGQRVHSVGFSPDGSHVVSAFDDQTIHVWDTHSGARVLVIDGLDVDPWQAAYTPDGAHIIAVLTDGTFKVWDARSGELIESLMAAGTDVRAIGLSPDGDRIVAAGADSNLNLALTNIGTNTDADTNATIDDLPDLLAGHEKDVWSVAFFPDGNRMISGSADQTLRVWDTNSNQLIATLRGHQGSVNAVSISADGQAAVSGSDDGTLRLWQIISDDEFLTTLTADDAVNTLDLDADDRVAIGSDDGSISLWDGASGDLLKAWDGHEGGVWSVRFSPDGSKLVSGGADAEIRLWNVATGDLIAAFADHEGSVTTVDISPDGNRIVSGSWDTTLRLWDMASGEAILAINAHEDPIRSVDFSPDGDRILSASDDNTVRIWDAASGDQILAFKEHDNDVHAAVFSPDGSMVLSADADGLIHLWNVQSGESVTVLKGHLDHVWSAAFSLDGSRILSGGADGMVRLWDAVSGEPLAILKGNQAAVAAVKFTTDSQRILIGSADKTARLLWIGHHLDELIAKAPGRLPRNVDDSG